jgi:hypothetical protein
LERSLEPRRFQHLNTRTKGEQPALQLWREGHHRRDPQVARRHPLHAGLGWPLKITERRLELWLETDAEPLNRVGTDDPVGTDQLLLCTRRREAEASAGLLKPNDSGNLEELGEFSFGLTRNEIRCFAVVKEQLGLDLARGDHLSAEGTVAEQERPPVDRRADERLDDRLPYRRTHRGRGGRRPSRRIRSIGRRPPGHRSCRNGRQRFALAGQSPASQIGRGEQERNPLVFVGKNRLELGRAVPTKEKLACGAGLLNGEAGSSEGAKVALYCAGLRLEPLSELAGADTLPLSAACREEREQLPLATQLFITRAQTIFLEPYRAPKRPWLLDLSEPACQRPPFEAVGQSQSDEQARLVDKLNFEACMEFKLDPPFGPWRFSYRKNLRKNDRLLCPIASSGVKRQQPSRRKCHH